MTFADDANANNLEAAMSLSMNEFASHPVSVAWIVRDSVLLLGAFALFAVGEALLA